MKFTVEYRRTVRIQPYETLTIGTLEEFDKSQTNFFKAYETVRNQVDYHIETERDRLKGEIDEETE